MKYNAVQTKFAKWFGSRCTKYNGVEYGPIDMLKLNDKQRVVVIFSHQTTPLLLIFQFNMWRAIESRQKKKREERRKSEADYGAQKMECYKYWVIE